MAKFLLRFVRFCDFFMTFCFFSIFCFFGCFLPSFCYVFAKQQQQHVVHAVDVGGGEPARAVGHDGENDKMAESAARIA